MPYLPNQFTKSLQTYMPQMPTLTQQVRTSAQGFQNLIQTTLGFPPWQAVLWSLEIKNGGPVPVAIGRGSVVLLQERDGHCALEAHARGEVLLVTRPRRNWTLFSSPVRTFPSWKLKKLLRKQKDLFVVSAWDERAWHLLRALRWRPCRGPLTAGHDCAPLQLEEFSVCITHYLLRRLRGSLLGGADKLVILQTVRWGWGPQKERVQIRYISGRIYSY